MAHRKSRVERFLIRLRSKPVVVVAIAFATLIIALSSFTDATRNLAGLFRRSTPEEARAGLAKLSLSYSAETFIERVRQGDLTAVKLFLSAGMNPNTKSPDGDTALAIATANGRANVVEALRAAGAKTEATPVAVTTLVKAIEQDPNNDGISSEIRAAIDSTSNVDDQNEQGMSALHLAADRGNVTLARALLEKSPHVDLVCHCDGYHSALNWTPLQMAAFKRHADIVELLLARGADVKHVNSAGETPLHPAAYGGNAKAVQALLDKGADVNARDNEGETPLMEASLDDADTTRALLDGRADINAKDHRGWTALIHDAYWGREDRVHVLLERGAQVNVTGVDGETALITAAANERGNVVRILLEKHADARVKDKHNKTALDYAAALPDQRSREAILSLLK